MKKAKSTTVPADAVSGANAPPDFRTAIAELEKEFKPTGSVVLPRVLKFLAENLAGSCPSWVHKISRKLIQAGLLLATEEECPKVTRREVGRGVGSTIAALHYMQKGALAPVDDPKLVKVQTDIAVAAPQILKALDTESSLESSLEDAAEYARGKSEGLNAAKGGSSKLVPDKKRIAVYFTLLCGWREVVKFKTRPEIFVWLDKQFKDQPPDYQAPISEKAFYRLCDDIGLKVAKPGRPKKTTTG